MVTPHNKEIEQQIREKRHIVDYDVKEYPIEVIVDKYLTGIKEDNNDIFIPSYQRAFVWSKERQSKFIESILLGLPMPYIFTAENEDGRLEVVDGSQRIRTLVNFMQNNLRLQNLDILNKLNGLKYNDFSRTRQRKFRSTSLRMTVLSEKSDEDIRFIVFERINAESVSLTKMEIRRGIQQGKFTDFLYEASAFPLFKKMTSFTKKTEERGEPQELILRFFAYSDNYLAYTGNLNQFLTDYIDEKNKGFDKKTYVKRFNEVLTFVDKYFPLGFLEATHHNYTKRSRFEALSVGVYLALQERPDLTANNIDWLELSDFLKYISGSARSAKRKVQNRIEFVRDKLLANG
ncbi:MAG: GmrSD restriction endonuclease domain-containing protein [Chitinophagales bacterium]